MFTIRKVISNQLIHQGGIHRRIKVKELCKTFSTNITYSGGQATVGQGGYYGSGGSRVIEPDSISITDKERSRMLAFAGDVEHIKSVMDELQTLEHLLARDQEEHDGKVTNNSIELRGKIKKILTNPNFTQCLDRLEFNGAPVWGLSTMERELISLAREKVNGD